MKDTVKALDDQFLRQTLILARKGLGRTLPNPMVGAIIVKHRKIIGKGYHHQFGKAHAEIEALRNIKDSAKDATLYVNLEPCSHQGKTPPCVEAIILSGISRVVCSTLDPNPSVCGNGVALLRQAGINVSVGAMTDEAKLLNEAFFQFHEQHRPYIAIKFAASLDGKIATYSHDSKWITNEKARLYARSLRSKFQAVLVGVNTVNYDNPNLGIRIHGKSDPLRIVLDNTLRIASSSQILRDNNVLIITSRRASKSKLNDFNSRGIPIYICKNNIIRLPEVMEELSRREIISVLVEGGGSVLGSFIDARLADKVYAFYGPIIIGGTAAISAVAGLGTNKVSNALQLNNLSIKRFDDTFMISANVSNLA